MMKFETSLTTRFCESDYMGHISNISYFIYFEVARVNFLSGLGISTVDEHWDFIIASIKCDFVKQIYVNRTIQIETQVKRIGNKSISLAHRLYNEQGELAASVDEVVVRFNRGSQSSVPLEPDMMEKLQPYLAEE